MRTYDWRNRALDPRKLLYFATVVEHGSFKKAAKHLNISQPALSTSMDRFERSLGERLLDRGPSGVSPTPAGDILYAHARLIREELTLAERRVATHEHQPDDMVVVGTLPSLIANIIPSAVCRWRTRHPGPTLRVIEKIQLELLISLVRGELDFIIAQTEWYGFMEGLRQRVLFRDRLYVLGRPGHPAFERDDVTLGDLARYPWVIQMIGRQRSLLEKLLAQEQVGMPASLTECGSVNFLKSIVAGSDSLAMLPGSAVDADVHAGKLRPFNFNGPLFHRDIAVIYRDEAPLSQTSKELVEAVANAGLKLASASLATDPPNTGGSADDL
ncbi:hypothetical protein TSH100_10335 [Azospirillum sp. TSH100]|nr:hypothetical protein TSH100_10335 [Azospirillum sp. TSH100]